MRRFFWEVTDFRKEGRCLHESSDIILLVLCGLLADCETFEEIYHHACDNEPVLCQLLALPAGIPSPHTLQRVFRHLNPVELEASLTRWDQDLVHLLVGHQLVIDDKQLRGTRLPGQRQAPVQLVSVGAAEQRLCLAQTQVAAKRNELVAIPLVLDLVEVRGSVASIDAMGCQRVVAATLVERGADYMLALKDNQRTLADQVRGHFAPLLAQPPAFVQALPVKPSELSSGALVYCSCAQRQPVPIGSLVLVSERHAEKTGAGACNGRCCWDEMRGRDRSAGFWARLILPVAFLRSVYN